MKPKIQIPVAVEPAVSDSTAEATPPDGLDAPDARERVVRSVASPEQTRLGVTSPDPRTPPPR